MKDRKHITKTGLAALFLTLFSTLAVADEGMWTFDNVPVQQIQSKYGFTPTKEWLDHLRLSCVRFNDGGSGSFVSPHGLVLTNHHVALDELQKASTKEHDYAHEGFYAATPDQELKSPDLEVNVLVSMEDVTARVNDALKGAATPEKQFAARRAVFAQITRESQDKTGLRSDIVTLYGGGEYWLYRYKRYTDVRIVFAPEQQIAFFGGDPDNFTYPRYDLDMALFRVYENGKPVDSSNYLQWNPNGARDGELVFVAGNPGSTQRQDTMAQIEMERDTVLPDLLTMFRSRIATLRQYSALGPEQDRRASGELRGLENGRKLFEGEVKGLDDPHVIATKQKSEEDFRARVMANAELKTKYGDAWDQIAEAERKMAPRAKEIFFRSTDSDLAELAQLIVEYVAEIKKPDGERLPGFHDAQLESLKQQMFSPAPIYKDMEIARITGSLELAEKELPASDPFLVTTLNGQPPKQVATELVNGTQLEDPAVRKRLVERGEAAVNASNDPMIVLARKLDPMRRQMIKWRQDNVQSVVQAASAKLGKARFAVYGKSIYPDATFTLRLSYGQVKGYPMNGTIAPPKTTYYGLYDRAASFDYASPFDLPSRYAEERNKLNLATPLNFVTTNDIVGGNSGSPVVNRAGQIVGLIFDGNIESLVGDFVYDGETNRSVAVHTSGMTEALRKLYPTQKVLDELMGTPVAQAR